MLRPFRIRNLYFDSPDLIDRSGVVQLSSQQYDHEIKTLPEAVITYIDEDDGETVTVGPCPMHFAQAVPVIAHCCIV